MSASGDIPERLGKVDHPPLPGTSANRFFVEAQSFLEAGKALIPSHLHSTTRPIYLLLCQSLELALKAYLCAKGLNNSDVTKSSIRHSLIGLHDRCVELGLRFDDAIFGQMISQMHIFHIEHVFRYPDVELRSLPNPNELSNLIAKFIVTINSEVLSSALRDAIRCRREDIKEEHWILATDCDVD